MSERKVERKECACVNVAADAAEKCPRCERDELDIRVAELEETLTAIANLGYRSEQFSTPAQLVTVIDEAIDLARAVLGLKVSARYEALLDSATADEGSIAIVQALHSEMLGIGRRLVERNPAIRDHLRARSAPEQAARYFWDNADPVDQHAALAVVEAALSLGTILSEVQEGQLLLDGTFRIADRVVSDSYFHALVARRCGVDINVAAILWTTLVEYIVQSGTGLPGLSVNISDDTVSVLVSKY
jgi:hypothetical protein